jgi:hypothetical protein
MIRRYNLSHPAGQPMPEDWLDLPDSVVAAADYDALAARLAEAEQRLAMALIAIRTGMPEYNRVDVTYILTGDISAPACNHFPGQSTCEWCSAALPSPTWGKSDCAKCGYAFDMHDLGCDSIRSVPTVTGGK